MAEKMLLSEDQAMELLAFLVVSSRGVIDEPSLYGSFRLMDAAGRMLGFILDNGKVSDEDALRRMKERIDEGKMQMMTDEQGYVAFTEEMVRVVTKTLKKRSL